MKDRLWTFHVACTPQGKSGTVYPPQAKGDRLTAPANEFSRYPASMVTAAEVPEDAPDKKSKK